MLVAIQAFHSPELRIVIVCPPFSSVTESKTKTRACEARNTKAARGNMHKAPEVLTEQVSSVSRLGATGADAEAAGAWRGESAAMVKTAEEKKKKKIPGCANPYTLKCQTERDISESSLLLRSS
jgi:hypothetical protein